MVQMNLVWISPKFVCERNIAEWFVIVVEKIRDEWNWIEYNGISI